MYVKLIYDKRNVDGIKNVNERIHAELEKRVHRILPHAEVSVKAAQGNSFVESDCTKSEKEKLNRLIEEMFEDGDTWLTEED